MQSQVCLTLVQYMEYPDNTEIVLKLCVFYSSLYGLPVCTDALQTRSAQD